MGGAATTSAKGCNHSHTAICTHKVGQRGGEKQTRSGGGHQRCTNHTPSRPHVNQQRGAGSGTRASSSPSSLSTAREHTSSLPHTPQPYTPSSPLIWLTTTTTPPLLHSLNPPLITYIPQLTPMQGPVYKGNAVAPPPAHVLLHLHATPVSTSSKVACVSEMACFLFLSSSLLFVAPSPHPPHHLCTGSAAWWRTHLLH